MFRTHFCNIEALNCSSATSLTTLPLQYIPQAETILLYKRPSSRQSTDLTSSGKLKVFSCRRVKQQNVQWPTRQALSVDLPSIAYISRSKTVTRFIRDLRKEEILEREICLDRQPEVSSLIGTPGTIVSPILATTEATDDLPMSIPSSNPPLYGGVLQGPAQPVIARHT